MLNRIRSMIFAVTIFLIPHIFGEIKDVSEFIQKFKENYDHCYWKPHEVYSVFTQYDKHYYLAKKTEFMHKYRCFYALSKTIHPKTMIELGALAGSAADAYISGSGAKYIGYDLFGENRHHDNNATWVPLDVIQKLFQERQFKDYRLIKSDLRDLNKLPQADFVVVDAAHDFKNEYADLKLALTANPTFIFVDDTDGKECAQAVQKFLAEDIKDRVDFATKISYIGGGTLIKLKQA